MDEKYVISDCTYGQRKRFDEVIHTFECEDMPLDDRARELVASVIKGELTGDEAIELAKAQW